MPHNLTCVILAGGLGTRLRSVITDVPKPMAMIDNRPFLEYLLLQISAAAIDDVILCVGYKAEVVENYFGDGKKFNLRIRYSKEKAPLGTAGALALAKPLITTDTLIALNGDSFCEVDYQQLIKQHQSSNALATIVAVRVENRSQCASVEFDGHNAIISFREKQGIPEPGFISSGIYVLEKKFLDSIPLTVCSLERDIFPKLIKENKVITYPI